MLIRGLLALLGFLAVLGVSWDVPGPEPASAATLAIASDGPAQAQQANGSSPILPTQEQPEVPGIPAEAFQGTSGVNGRMIPQMQGPIYAPPPTPATEGVPRAPSAVQGTADVTVNDPSLDTPENTTQSETTLAVHGTTVCAGYNDSGVGGITGFSRSPDLGVTWIDRGGMGQGSDPVLAVHEATGTFYFAEIAFLGGATAIGVAKSSDDCNSFPALANASPATSAPADFQDKPWIAVDNTGGLRDGYVYVCWTRFADNFPGPSTAGEIRVSRSTDAGVTFGDEQVISPPTDNFPFGCDIDVGTNGEVDVAWADRNFFADFPIRFRRSLDGGLTWEPSVQVNTSPVRAPGLDRIIDCGGGDIRPTLNADIRMLQQAHLAVDTTGGPFDGNIYIVWAGDPVGPIDNSDVFFSYSTDGGLTWTPEVQVAGGTITDQFEPFVEVGGQGTVSIAWYDRRNDPDNNFDIDVYTTFSSDGGATLFPVSRLTDVSFPVPPISGQPGNFDPGITACYMGEYIAIAADASNFYYAWGDNRNTVVSANYPAGRPDPDVFFDRQPVVIDTDGDGCLDKRELGLDETQGGLRDPLDFWDFMDVPAGATLVRDKAIVIQDISAVVARFGAQDAGAGTFDRNSDPLSTPNQVSGDLRENYHPAYDRGAPNGPYIWNREPPDGAIVIQDIQVTVAQFGHVCL